MSHNNRRRWNPERTATLHRLIAKGWSVLRIADYLGTSEAAVSWQLGLLGITIISYDIAYVEALPERSAPSPAALRLAEFDPIVRRALSDEDVNGALD